MIIKDFMDILAWQKAQVALIDMYKHMDDMKDCFLREQILRAGIDISATIATGFERRSLGDFKELLYVAKGKVAEVRVLLNLARDLDQLDVGVYENLNLQLEDVSKLIYGFVKTFIDKKKKTTDQ